ncbi:MAG: acyl-phosphate glycerol 3-phosphate acyltransferase [Acidobacteria bacterium RIFCSPLOWO2_02_FULL_60_20]|nr:MAG: acyl-phosphate glycerol 3-phosphate acyltransferase [Acidobacteria bacterium RIFCSPLOWO2_02_FULL_60_20]
MILRDMLLAGLSAYLLGSIPFGYLLYRLRGGQDIRSTGSGSIGATNVFRAAGFLTAASTFLLDAGKGFLAVLVADRLTSGSAQPMALAVVLVMAGHCFPVFLKFRGGKGVATGLGAFLAISPIAVLLCTVIFAGVLGVFRFASLASVLAAAVFPFVVLMLGGFPDPILIAAFAGAGLIIARHRANIQRLRAGTEMPIWGRRKTRAG